VPSLRIAVVADLDRLGQGTPIFGDDAVRELEPRRGDADLGDRRSAGCLDRDVVGLAGSVGCRDCQAELHRLPRRQLGRLIDRPGADDLGGQAGKLHKGPRCDDNLVAGGVPQGQLHGLVVVPPDGLLASRVERQTPEHLELPQLTAPCLVSDCRFDEILVRLAILEGSQPR
jgi:hypothetical protein